MDGWLERGAAVRWPCSCVRCRRARTRSPTHPWRAQVFSPDTTQERLYNTAVAGLVAEVLEGYNATIFAYGE